jgi:hypothetical protein
MTTATNTPSTAAVLAAYDVGHAGSWNWYEA